MQSVNIEGTLRTDLGKKYAKSARAEGHVPCVMYGGDAPIHFSAPTMSFRDLLYTKEARKAAITIDGTVYEAILQDSQWHVVTDQVQHLDFIQVLEGKPVTLEVPIALIGMAKGVRNGGSMKIILRTVRVRGLINDIPSLVEHNIEALRIGDSLHMIEVKKGKPYEILNIDSAVIVTIKTSRVAVEEEEEESEGEEGAEDGAENAENAEVAAAAE